MNGSLTVSLTGSDSAVLTEVTLVETAGTGEIKGTVFPQGSGSFLVHFERIPSVEFVVRVKGLNESVSPRASVAFQRQSPTNFRASNLTVTVSTHHRPSQKM